MTTKHIENWLVIDWKSGATRTRKSEPDDVGTHELATQLSIDVEIPDVDVPELAAKVQVPQPVVQTAVLESLDGETFPEWSDVAEEHLEENVDAIKQASGLDQVDAIVERLTTRTLLEYDGVVDAENVQAFLRDHAHRIHKDAGKRV